MQLDWFKLPVTNVILCGFGCVSCHYRKREKTTGRLKNKGKRIVGQVEEIINDAKKKFAT